MVKSQGREITPMYKETSGVLCCSQPRSTSSQQICELGILCVLDMKILLWGSRASGQVIHCQESAKPHCVASSHFTCLFIVLKLQKQENWFFLPFAQLVSCAIPTPIWCQGEEIIGDVWFGKGDVGWFNVNFQMPALYLEWSLLLEEAVLLQRPEDSFVL